MYLSIFMISILTDVSIPLHEKHLHNINDPLPNLTMSVINAFLYVSFLFLQIRISFFFPLNCCNSNLLSSLYIIFFQNDSSIFTYFFAKAKRFFILLLLIYGLLLTLQYFKSAFCNLHFIVFVQTFNPNVFAIFLRAILGSCRHLRTIRWSS